MTRQSRSQKTGFHRVAKCRISKANSENGHKSGNCGRTRQSHEELTSSKQGACLLLRHRIVPTGQQILVIINLSTSLQGPQELKTRAWLCSCTLAALDRFKHWTGSDEVKSAALANM